MEKKLLPIYNYSNKNTSGYTIFIDIKTMRVYKVFNENVNLMSNWKYWISIPLVSALLSSLSTDSLSVGAHIIIAIAGSIAAGTLGYLIQRRILHNYKLQEIFLTKEMIEDYIERGKGRIKLEVSLIVAFTFISIFLLTIYVALLRIELLIVFFIFLFILGLLVPSVSITRFKVLKQGLNYLEKKNG
ncbi:hypothetical protein GMD78_05510 [Ornithinibacillus sp. L9]|uniref:Tandem five-TM protein n=1 Tax=Ornithinibacillus caprae TaxID=2678566 RepID=A0A6N8FEL6_9BACI|nr:hypothetical protein [Ornithinibacillus caprae]MUK87855.1 hypothetical protein [Ornithinibacillus caprae]